MTRAKRGFGSVRFVLAGVIVLGALTACGGSGSSSTGLTSNSSGAPGVSSSAGGTSSAGDTAAANPGTGGTGTVATTPPPASPPPASPPPAAPAPNGVNLAWVAPTENSDGTPLTDLKGYKIHYGTESQNYTGSISVDNPTVTNFLVDSLPAGTYYFAVTAYNAAGAESSLSDEIQTSLN